jgi:tRNA-modifying protein YgfZ
MPLTAALLAQLSTQGACFDLSTRAKWRLSGSDRVRYLNGQVTNDIRRASAQDVQYACVTDVKGRIVGDIHVHADAQADALCFDAEPELRDVLGPRLERYIIADDCELSDVTEDWALLHLVGQMAETIAQRMDLPAAARRVATAHRLQLPGIDLWLPAGTDLATLLPGVEVADAATCAAVQTLLGIPRYPTELNDHTFPPEAKLEARAMSFTKGCYIGQEVLSRIKTTGKMPRALVRWSSAAQVSVGDAWFPAAAAAGADAATVIPSLGQATSSVLDPRDGCWRGLGYVKQALEPSDSVLLARNQEPRLGPIVEISALPKQ